ncbi:hypothetical protein QUF75_05685 [Desulfococcaceae bacterium HSG7]|nr:hypothetical protein [Desulfococcaceae bacterium HSG7]
MRQETMDELIEIVDNGAEGYSVEDVTEEYIDKNGNIKKLNRNVNGYRNDGVYFLQSDDFELYLAFTQYSNLRFHIFAQELTNRDDLTLGNQAGKALGEFHRDDIEENNQRYLTLGYKKYVPYGRDGKNEVRKKTFIDCYTDEYEELHVYLPVNDNFLDELFKYAKCRYKADYLIESDFSLSKKKLIVI